MYSAYYLFFAVSSLISFYPVGEDLQKNLLIDTVKFVTQFKEAPCNQWLRFRASGRKGMAFIPRGETPGFFFFFFFFLYLCWTPFFFSYNLPFFATKKIGMKRHLRKDKIPG